MTAITQLMASEEKNVPKMASEIVEAVFFIHHISEYGKDGLIRDILNGNTFQPFRTFIKTETGKAWYNWYRGHEGRPPLD
jgi:hypothetical protein